MQELDIIEIMKILPHRYPFLLVDKVIDLDLEKGRVHAQKNLTMNEAFFQGHFPETPLMPGVLIIEAMAQAGGILIHSQIEKGKVALLLNIKNAKFRHPVKPGDVLELHCSIVHISGKAGKVAAEARVGSKVAAEAEISFALVEQTHI